MLSHLDIDVDEILKELERRFGLSGLEEKANR
jgi:phosphoribosyl-ATP pyrophosphohydrolase